MPNASQRLRRWMTWRWAVVAALLAVTAALGFQGFSQHFSAAGEKKSIFDLVYLTGQLFTMESGAVDGPMPTALQLARFLGPLASAYAVGNAVLGLFTTQLRKVWIHLRGDHVVVCGLGRKGAQIVEELRDAGQRVVVIEPDEQNPNLAQCKELGCHVITGKANDPWNLNEACIRRARVLLAMAGDDGVNIETAVRAHELVQGRRGKRLRCIAHVSDSNLEKLFRRHDAYAVEDDPLELELFNTFETAARVMLREAGVGELTGQCGGDADSYLIVGMGQLGEALLLRLLKDWQIDATTATGKLRIAIVDTEAEQRRRHFQRRYPGLLETAQVDFLAIDIHDPELAARLPRPVRSTGKAKELPCRAAFVCIDDDSQGLYAALSLRNLIGPNPPIFVRMSEEAGLASVMGAAETRAGVLPGVIAVGMLDIACSLEFVLGGTREILAQAIHQGYVADQIVAGQIVGQNPSLAPWHRLPEDLKQSNRGQAEHIREKLRWLGCELAPRAGYPFTLLEFVDEEIELLAEIEHERWMAERKAAGWSHGETKVIETKKNPLLVPWDQLPPEAKAYNRDAVRRIPKVLAKADIEILRIAQPRIGSIISSYSQQSVAPRRRQPTKGKPQAA